MSEYIHPTILHLHYYFYLLAYFLRTQQVDVASFLVNHIIHCAYIVCCCYIIYVCRGGRLKIYFSSSRVKNSKGVCGEEGHFQGRNEVNNESFFFDALCRNIRTDEKQRKRTNLSPASLLSAPPDKPKKEIFFLVTSNLQF